MGRCGSKYFAYAVIAMMSATQATTQENQYVHETKKPAQGPTRSLTMSPNVL